MTMEAVKATQGHMIASSDIDIKTSPAAIRAYCLV